tara:strand:- start:434 stop:1234 length:801 start_codon:yes stop_codon:yes gene_type:complete
MKKVVLVTGASSGIGLSVANYLHLQKKYIVYGTSRKINNSSNFSFNLIELDVTEKLSIQRCIADILKKESKIDILINNAGVGITGPLEEIPTSEINKHFKINVFGPILLIKEVLPSMKSSKNGVIINITSVAAQIATPFRSIYSGGKAALDIISETLAMEVRSLGIDVVSIAPGDFKTNISKRRFHSPVIDKSDYKSYAESLKKMNLGVNNGSDPEKIAKLVSTILLKRRPRIRYKVGSFIEKNGVILKRILPQRIYEKLILKLFS